MSVLDYEIRRAIAAALAEADVPQSAVLTRNVRDPMSPAWAPTFNLEMYQCKGLVDSFSAAERADVSVLSTDVKVLIVAETLSDLPFVPAPDPEDVATGLLEPIVGDRVTIGGRTYSVERVSTDPAGALWQLQGRA